MYRLHGSMNNHMDFQSLLLQMGQNSMYFMYLFFNIFLTEHQILSFFIIHFPSITSKSVALHNFISKTTEIQLFEKHCPTVVTIARIFGYICLYITIASTAISQWQICVTGPKGFRPVCHENALIWCRDWDDLWRQIRAAWLYRVGRHCCGKLSSVCVLTKGPFNDLCHIKMYCVVSIMTCQSL